MFGSPKTPIASSSRMTVGHVSPAVAAELAQEYEALRAEKQCPTSVYVIPSEDSLLKWHGVLHVHKGPYAGSVLRFSLLFAATYPAERPTVRLDAEVYHPMIDPRSKIWYPRGRIAQWQPGHDHVCHLLLALKSSFKSRSLDAIGEDEAINKHVWSLYRHSRQTFLSMTAQRALKSTTKDALYSPAALVSPASPTPSSVSKDPRQSSGPLSGGGLSTSSSGGGQDTTDVGPITFRHLSENEVQELLAQLRSREAGRGSTAVAAWMAWPSRSMHPSEYLWVSRVL